MILLGSILELLCYYVECVQYACVSSIQLLLYAIVVCLNLITLPRYVQPHIHMIHSNKQNMYKHTYTLLYVYSLQSKHPLRLTPGVKEFIAALHSKQVPVYLVSGGFRQVRI